MPCDVTKLVCIAWYQLLEQGEECDRLPAWIKTHHAGSWPLL